MKQASSKIGPQPVFTLSVIFILFAIQTTVARAGELQPVEIVPEIRHSSPVGTVAFSRDGARVLSSDANTLKLWDVATGRLVRTVSDAGGATAFSPDGTRLLSGRWHDSLKLWDAASGRLIRTFEGRVGLVYSVAFSPDGTRVLSGDDKTLKLWDASTGRLLRVFEGHSEYVTEIAFSPSGDRVLSGSNDKSMKLWDVETGRVIRTFEGHSDKVTAVAFSPNGQRVLSGGDDNALRLWDTSTGRFLRSFVGHLSNISSVTFSSDGTRLLSGSWDRSLKLWDVATGQLVRNFEGNSDYVLSVAVSPDDTRILSGGWDHSLRLWDAVTGQAIRTFGISAGVRAVTWSPDGTRVLSGGDDNSLKLWNAASGRLIRVFNGHSAEVMSVAFSPDGTRVLSGSDDKTTKIWDAATGQSIRTMNSGQVWSVSWSPDGLRVLSGGTDGSVKLWDAGTGGFVRAFKGHARNVGSVAISSDNKRVLSGSDDNTIKLWDVATGRLIRTFTGHTAEVRAVAFSPDGSRLVSGSLDNTFKLWDAETGKLVRTEQGHSVGVVSLGFSPDGHQLVSGSWDSTVKVWESATGNLFRTFKGHSGYVSSAVISPDGVRLASAGFDGTIRIWNTEATASGDEGSLLATLISGQGGQEEWMTILPQGFFVGGSRANGIVSIVRGFDVFTVDRIWQSLFNPDLVREALAGDPNGEVAEAAKAVNLEVVVNSGPAPEVAITSHLSGDKSATDLITVRGLVTDKGRGIGRIEWRVNGITAAITPRPSNGGPAYTITERVALHPGENTIQLVAYNESNLLASAPVTKTITFTGQADQTKPRLHILAIGVNDYVDKGWALPGQGHVSFPKLNLAVKDAEALAADFKRAAKDLYSEAKITLALDGDATRGKLEVLVDRLSAEVGPRDTFVFFAAAHGISERGRFYLIPQDYQSGPDALGQRAIGQDMLQDWLVNKIRAGKALILLDTCESGALVAGHLHARGDAPASEAGIGRLHEATGRPVLTAAAGGQSAWEGVVGDSGQRHGIFTWALLDALRKADSNGNDMIEIAELVAHVQSVVPGLAKRAADIRGEAEGRAAFEFRRGQKGEQSARYGSRGEDFALVRRLPR